MDEIILIQDSYQNINIVFQSISDTELSIDEFVVNNNGDTTISKASVEAVLTGYITSHSHYYEPLIVTGLSTQYWGGNKTWQNFSVVTLASLSGYSTSNPSNYISSISSTMITTALGFTPYNSSNPNNFISSINSSNVISALGFTPYSNSNPNNYLSSINSTEIISALGFTPYSNSNPNGFLSTINSTLITNALGFTPYNSSNPSNFISSITKANVEAVLIGSISSHNHNYESVLGNPSSDGYVLSSSASGVRLWIAPVSGGTGGTVLNGNGFVKASGTSVTYDNNSYYLSSNPNNYITGITSSNVTSALGFTPLATNGSASNLTGFPTLNQSTTGTASNITATSNTSLNSLSNLTTIGTLVAGSVPYSLLSGTIPTWNQSTTGSASNITATSNTTLTSLSNLTTIGTLIAGSIPYSLLSGTVPTWNQNTTGTASSFTGSLVGDVTGTQGATAIAATTVTSKLITGFVSGAGTVSATDSILIALNKLAGNDANKQTLSTNLTSLAGLSYVSGSFVKLTGTNTFTLDTNTYLASGGALGTPASGTLTNCTFPTLNQSTTGTASNITATSNSTLTTISTLTGIGTLVTGSVPYTLLSGTVPTWNQNTTGSASSFTGSLVGDVTGTQGATAIAATTVTGKLLTNYVSGAGTVASTDTILQAINKLNGNDNLRALIAGQTFTGNIFAPSVIAGFTTIATAGSTTTLTVNSNYNQIFTGILTQTLVLPVVSTLVLGQSYTIINNSTGAVTINTSGGNTLIILAGGTSCIITCQLITGTGIASWDYTYFGINITSGKVGSINNSITLAGTDATTITFQGSDTYVGRTTTDTLTNKRNQTRIYATTSTATLTPEINTYDKFNITALAVALNIANHSASTPADGEKIMIRIKDNATARALTFGTYYRALGNALPSTTVISKIMYLGFIWNSTDTTWDLIAYTIQA